MSERMDFRPDVPPLSDLSRQRIRQAVFEQLDREPLRVAAVAAPTRHRRAAVMALVAAAAAAVIAVVAVRGLGGETGQAARPPSPSRLETGESPSQVTVGDARITAGPHAALTVSEASDAAVQVVIERGAIEFAVAPRADRPPFVVLAADVRVEVVGTAFTVTRDGDEVAVSVSRGVVRVARAGDPAVRVAAGRSWPAAEGEPAPAAASEEELTFEPDPAPARSPSPRSKRKPAEPDAAAPPPAPSPRERYEAAAAAEQTRPGEALATYRALAAEAGAWADNALFAQASLELKLGRKEAARRSLRTYLERYPRGANAGLARALLDGLQ